MQVVRNGIAQRRRGVTIDRRRVFQSDPYAAYLAYDSFTGTLNDPVQSRSPEKGSWTVETAGRSFLLDGAGSCTPQNTTNPNVVYQSLSADGYFNASYTKTTAGDTAHCSIMFNYQDSTNYWRFGTYFNLIALQEIVAGVQTDRYIAVRTWNNGQTYLFKVWAAGDTIKVYQDGSLLSTYTVGNRPLKTATGVGFREWMNGTDKGVFNLFTAALTDI